MATTQKFIHKTSRFLIYWNHSRSISSLSKMSSQNMVQTAQRCLYYNTFNHRTIHKTGINSAEKIDDESSNNTKLKRTGELAKVFAEYGVTGIAFHTTISLTSLGICYAAVSSGIDVAGWLQYYNIVSEETMQSKMAGGAGTFLIAYACHKVFMPVRIFITVTYTPIIVRKLRKFTARHQKRKE